MRDFIYRDEGKELGVRVCGMETGHTPHLGAQLLPYFFQSMKQPRPRDASPPAIFIKKGKD